MRIRIDHDGYVFDTDTRQLIGRVEQDPTGRWWAMIGYRRVAEASSRYRAIEALKERAAR